jgi:5'-3' exonuclease
MQYGELVLCCDNRKNWRKKFFPYYKAHRKKIRDDSDHDWNTIFQCLNQVKTELVENFPYKVLEVDTAEADDIIGILCRYLSDVPILILSGDKDFMQLHTNPNVKQYSPIQKRFLKTDDPKKFLQEHIMRGDKGDGVPNFLSADDTFVNNGARQKPISKLNIAEWVKHDNPEIFCDYKMLRGYKRNQQLVDLSFVPDTLQTQIIECYNIDNDYEEKRKFLLGYFMEKRLKHLMEHLDEF